MRPVSSVPCDLSVDSIGCHRPAQLREGLCRGEGISGVMEKDMVQHTQAPADFLPVLSSASGEGPRSPCDL